jgi:hypothetical protein
MTGDSVVQGYQEFASNSKSLVLFCLIVLAIYWVGKREEKRLIS